MLPFWHSGSKNVTERKNRMAEKKNGSDPQLGLIVAELRKLNHASKKDLIRDKEDRDRA